MYGLVAGFTATSAWGTPASRARPAPTRCCLDRLYEVLKGLHARHRGRPGPPLEPARHHLGAGHLLLATDAGWLDVLGVWVGGRGYPELLPHTVLLEIEGRNVRVLDLPTILTIKRELGAPKDQAQTHLIEATLKLRGEA